jgi:hypothetical protein
MEDCESRIITEQLIFIGIMLVRKLKEEPLSDRDRATGAYRLVGARPVEHVCGSYFGSVKEKSNRSWGSRGLAPWAASPIGGERGSPSQFPRQLKKLERISTEPIK